MWKGSGDNGEGRRKLKEIEAVVVVGGFVFVVVVIVDFRGLNLRRDGREIARFCEGFEIGV